MRLPSLSMKGNSVARPKNPLSFLLLFQSIEVTDVATRFRFTADDRFVNRYCLPTISYCWHTKIRGLNFAPHIIFSQVYNVLWWVVCKFLAVPAPSYVSSLSLCGTSELLRDDAQKRNLALVLLTVSLLWEMMDVTIERIALRLRMGQRRQKPILADW